MSKPFGREGHPLWLLCVWALGPGLPEVARSSSVVDVLPLTDGIVMVRFDDGHVVHSTVGQPYGPEAVVRSVLETSRASLTNSYLVSSDDDPAYEPARRPVSVGRKTKGTDFSWNGDPAPRWVQEHWIYLTLPQPMRRGKSYSIDTGTLAGNGRNWPLVYDETRARSEAVHVNLMGYVPGAPQKYAYVYHWAGNQGSLDLSSYAGRAFRLIDQPTGASVFSGTLVFRGSATQTETGQTGETPNNNFLGAEVYECDFSSFKQPGQYVVSVDGIGCSFPFRVGADVYREAFRKVARGLYHNRSGIALTTNCTAWPRPAPHNPVLTPGFANKLFYTTNRFVEWGSEGGDAARLQAGFRGYVESAGWYQDAGDWDSYYSHLAVASHLLFVHEMAPRNFSDGELKVPEGMNGVPDILDEAAWLPRFLYRLRHELMAKGYSHGGVGLRIAGDAFGSDTGGHVRGSWWDTNRLWAVSGADPWSTYKYAGTCAHLAYCLSLTGARDPDGIDWVAEAIAAYNWAKTNTLAGDANHPSAPVALKYPRAYAAAALFRVTGAKSYETQFKADIPNTSFNNWAWEQGEPAYPVMLYTLGGGAAQYDAATLAFMRNSMIITGTEYGIHTAGKRSLRWGGNFYFPMLVGQQTAPNVLEVAVACAVARKLGQTAKAQQLLGCLYTTADYFLGCNSLNMTWATGLGARHPQQVFHLDAWVGGYHPGMVPYGPWKTELANPTWVTDHDFPNLTVYPAIEHWPGNERWHDNRWSPMSSEFTITQTIAPSAALFGLLCAPGPDAPAAPPTLKLSIRHASADAFAVTWPAESSGGLVLQETLDVASPTNWSAVARVPEDDGTNKRVVVPAATNRAFRLKWP